MKSQISKEKIRKSAGLGQSPFLAYLVTATLTLALFYLLYGSLNLRQPLVQPVGDYASSALMAKTAMQTGWCSTNNHLGAPYDFECYDFPTAEGLNYAFFGLFGLFSDDAVLAVNLHYLLGYLLIVLTALYTFRQFGFATLPSMSASILYAFLPYHYLRSEYHLSLSAYFLLPLVILLLVWIYTGEPLFEIRKARRWPIAPTAKGWAALVVCVLTGSSSIYYSAFGAMFLLLTGLFTVSRTKDWKSFLAPSFGAFLICATVLVNLTPNFLFFGANGINKSVAHRTPGDGELYALKITNLLLPTPSHRWQLAAKLTRIYEANVQPAGERAEALGVFMGVGFVILVVTFVFAIGFRAPPELLIFFSRLNLATLLVATVGGFGSLFNWLVSPQIRAYGRLSVYIAFFSLGALLCVLRSLELRFCSSPRRALILNAVAAVILLAGWWDLTIDMNRFFPPFLADYHSDRDFVQRVEASVPKGSMIYQMPYFPYPEHGPIRQITDYEPARGYLFSKQLRWSYGAVTGRPAGDWQSREASLPPRELVPSLKAAGFCGIWIDSFGYEDRAAGLFHEFVTILGVPPLESANRRFLFFPLSGCPGEVDVLPQVSFAGCWGLESAGRTTWRWCGKKAEIRITNPRQTTQSVKLKMSLRTTYPEFSNFHVAGDLGTWNLRANITGTVLNADLKVPQGSHSIQIESDALPVNAPKDPRTMYFQISDFDLTSE